MSRAAPDASTQKCVTGGDGGVEHRAEAGPKLAGLPGSSARTVPGRPAGPRKEPTGERHTGVSSFDLMSFMGPLAYRRLIEDSGYRTRSGQRTYELPHARHSIHLGLAGILLQKEKMGWICTNMPAGSLVLGLQRL